MSVASRRKYSKNLKSSFTHSKWIMEMFRSLSFPMKNRKHLFLSLTKISLCFPSLNSLENYPWVAERPRPQIAITNTNTKVESPQSLRMTTLPSIVAPIRILRNSKENSNSLLTRHSLPFVPAPVAVAVAAATCTYILAGPPFPQTDISTFMYIYVYVCTLLHGDMQMCVVVRQQIS